MRLMNRVRRTVGPVILVAALSLHLPGCSAITSCLAEGTLIWTNQGPRPIEDICVGDLVWTRGKDKSMELGSVEHVRSAVSNRTIEFVLPNDISLRTTASHPISVDGQWLTAGKIRVGQQLLGPGGSVTVESLEQRQDPIRVFDLTVAPNANFFANGILVHNKTVIPPPTPDELAGIWVGQPTNDGGLYLIELEANGTGRVLRTRFNGEVEQLQFKSWQINEFQITIIASSESAEPYPPTVHAFTGRATRRYFYLQHLLSGIKNTAAPIVFTREELMHRDLDTLMASLRKGLPSPTAESPR